jgi:hypothetical protein
MKSLVWNPGLGIVATALLCCGNSVNGSVGAVTPFKSYEAEAGKLGGGASIVTLSPPTTEFASPQLEASGHAYVQLTANGQSVTITNTTGGNISALNLRSCIPDASGGGGITSTIDMYVNGTFRQALSVNSEQNYCYEGTGYNGQTDKNPADGDPRDFWNDTHYFITGAAVANGSTITFQKDSTNNATFYYIDVVDLENPPSALAQPANSLSIVSYGAVANNSSTDNTSAINSCFSACESQGKIAWIPSGTWYFSAINGGLNASGITIVGAGPWYSTLYRVTPADNTQGIANIITTTSCTISNLSLDCNANSRANDNNNGAVNSSGTNWIVDTVWIQHVTSSFWCAGVGGVARNCRTLSTWADGGNFNNVQSADGIGMNLTYSNNFVRGTGDDAMAINSVNTNGSTHYTIMSNTHYVNNTAVAPWGGKCMGIYGGISAVVTNNLLQDSGRYLGLGVMRFGVNGSDNYSSTVTGNTILRCGGNGYNQQQQGMMIGNGGDGQSVGTVANAYVASNSIIDSIYDGVGFSACANIVFQNNTINAPGLNGIAIGGGTIDLGTVAGDAVFLNNTVENLNSGETAVLTGGGEFQVYPPIQAASYSNAAPGVQTENCAEGGLDVGFITNGCWALYGQVNLAGITNFVARVASDGVGGSIQIRLGSVTGTLIGTCSAPVTGGWQTWTNQFCPISASSGCQNVYLVFTGGAGNWLFNLEYFALTGPNTQIPASDYDSESGVGTQSCSEGGLNVDDISNGSYTGYNSINMSGVTTFAARVASATTNGGVAGAIQIRVGSATGTVIGTCTVAGTDGWQNWVTETCLITNLQTGNQNIYLVDTGGGGNLFNIEWFSLQAGPLSGLNEAASFNSENSIQTENNSENGLDVGYISDGSYTVYNQIDLTGFTSFNARVASDGAGGNIQVCLDSPSNTPIGTCVVPITGGWQTWVTEQCSITPSTGFHNVYLLFNGGNGDGNLFNLEWFTFNY